MSLEALQPSYHGFGPSYSGCQYEPSITSSASSSAISVFSDTASSQSSIASSISDDFRSQDDARYRACNQGQTSHVSDGLSGTHCAVGISSLLSKDNALQDTCSYVLEKDSSIPAERRQNPRRCSLVRNQKPPPLVRQCERKVNFVDNLVDSATQMVEVIWPLSVVPCRSEGNSGRGVLPLRTYIEETLRRSRTSYSTLQVALYYLVLIKPHIPKIDFTMEQQLDCPASRALMCGRRMFLAALILASKYLQDRNYSAKAWSKMSGLKVCEINTNERTFLSKVNWKLHIPNCTFKRWTEIVLRYTPPMHPPPSSDHALAISSGLESWKSIVPSLTPDLEGIFLPKENVKQPTQQCMASLGFASPTTPTPSRTAMSTLQIASTSNENTPTPLTALPPRFLEPKPELQPPTPALARMGPLPTPQMTPSSVASSTPAASAESSRRPSMCSAMAFAQRNCVTRCTNDPYPISMQDIERCRTSSRRPSITSATSSGSSPESMISDNSHMSRASSTSSVSTVSTTLSLAPQRAYLARWATCRSARMPLPLLQTKEIEGTATKPITIVDDIQMVSSPDFAHLGFQERNAMPAKSKRTTCAHPPTSAPSAESRKKRPRSHGGRRSELQEEVRMQLEELDAMETISDADVASPSPACSRTSEMLSRCSSTFMVKEVQPPASISRRESNRLPIQKDSGKKRHCCSTSISSLATPPSIKSVYLGNADLYGEILH